ncbi:MAG: ABC transporter permease subunit [Planctomycetes bacterium]|nr:ABC transporter permease subunit [Planctomycetota bacterium]MCB9884826.1 ABC transporter permease subunit [Planctomycetota bacterium]
MRETMVIFRRELRSYFLSPIAYVFGLLFLAIVLFAASSMALVHGSQASMQSFFGMLPWVLLLFLPGLTMRLWAEERKSGTLELLMTFPVQISGLVIGKFAATLCFLAFLMVLTLGLPVTLDYYGSVDWPPVIAAYVASLLFTGSFVAVGMFWSSTTRDQIVAMLLSVVSLLVLFVLGYPTLLEAMAGWMPAVVVDVLNGVSPYKYFESIGRGVLDTRDVVYFACFCGFFLYANALVLQARRHKG